MIMLLKKKKNRNENIIKYKEKNNVDSEIEKHTQLVYQKGEATNTESAIFWSSNVA